MNKTLLQHYQSFIEMQQKVVPNMSEEDKGLLLQCFCYGATAALTIVYPEREQGRVNLFHEIQALALEGGSLSTH